MWTVKYISFGKQPVAARPQGTKELYWGGFVTKELYWGVAFLRKC